MAKTYNTSILSVYDENGNKIPVIAIKGKSAYEYAVDGGYTGTEDDFAKMHAGYVVPNFIANEAEAVAKEIKNARTAKSLVFPVLSDFHLLSGNEGNEEHDNSFISAKYAGMGVNELKRRLHLDFIGYLGDYTWGADNHTAEQVKKDITLVKETTPDLNTEVWCVGNHDLNYGKNRDRMLTLDEVYSYIGANSDGVKPYINIERCYGYIDFDNQKTRVIYLNTCDASDWKVTEGEAARSEWISPTQIQWLADTALNFTGKADVAEWGVVILGHHPLHYSASCFDNVMQLLEAYRDGLSGTMSCTVSKETADDGTVTYPQQTVTYDFSAENRAEIICNIHGHNHNCGASKISSTTRTGSDAVAPWLWRICIPNISANRYNTGADVGELYAEYDDKGNLEYHEKEEGTARATSFCVMNIDRKNKMIYAHIFGAGKYREFSYKPAYINLLPLAIDTDGTIYYKEDNPPKGYRTGYRLSSSGGTSASSPLDTAGFIPCKVGDTIYLKGIHYNKSSSNLANHRICFYDSSKTFVGLSQADNVTKPDTTLSGVYNSNDDLVQFTVAQTVADYDLTNVAYFRICGDTFDDNCIITVNQPIE